MRRRGFLVALTGGATAGYSKWIEPSWLQVTPVECRLPGFAPERPVRIVQLSDLHASPVVPNELIEEAVDLAIRQKPDLICVTGDFVTVSKGYDRGWYVRTLSRLAAAVPTFGTLGNHDGGWWSHRQGDGFETSRPVAEMVQESGIRLLHNRSERVTLGGKAIALVGLADIWAREFSPEESFEDAAKGPRIVLSHNPDTKDVLAEYKWDLMLSGHTHGGQVVIPGIGSPWAPVNDLRFLAGLKPWQGRYVQVSTGVGNAIGVRFNCRPEINLITIA